MAPERLRGHCDARSDVYSLGATLYELVTQTPAFDAPQRQQLIERILKSKPKPPRRSLPWLSAHIRARGTAVALRAGFAGA